MSVGWYSVNEEATRVSVIQLLYALTLTLIYQPVNYSLLCYLCIWLIKALDKISVSQGCKNTQKLLTASTCIYTYVFWTYICTTPTAHQFVLCWVGVRGLRQVSSSNSPCTTPVPVPKYQPAHVSHGVRQCSSHWSQWQIATLCPGMNLVHYLQII